MGVSLLRKLFLTVMGSELKSADRINRDLSVDPNSSFMIFILQN